MIMLHCDGPDCKNATRPNDPSWLTLSTEMKEFGRPGEWHYCSFSCAHAHTYLLISGDNGK